MFSIVESPLHPAFSDLLKQHGYQELKFTSQRKAIAALKETKPELVIADFIYGYGNNYAGVNISNLDVFLYSLQRYAAEPKVIVLVDKTEREHVNKLEAILPLHAILTYPVTSSDISSYL